MFEGGIDFSGVAEENQEYGIGGYSTVAIIGTQNSGKSTILNEIFRTKFEVLEKSKNGT